jgi:hypothetical protein
MIRPSLLSTTSTLLSGPLTKSALSLSLSLCIDGVWASNIPDLSSGNAEPVSITDSFRKPRRPGTSK